MNRQEFLGSQYAAAVADDWQLMWQRAMKAHTDGEDDPSFIIGVTDGLWIAHASLDPDNEDIAIDGMTPDEFIARYRDVEDRAAYGCTELAYAQAYDLGVVCYRSEGALCVATGVDDDDQVPL